MLTIPSPVDEVVEEVVRRTIGCCITVHRELGPGLLESVYPRAIGVELTAAGLSFETEKTIPITYKNAVIAHHRLDLVVEDCLLVEIKASERVAPIHRAQVISYLRASRLRVGLLVNFNVRFLPDGLRRIVV